MGKKANELVGFYTNFLKSLDVLADGDDVLSLHIPDDDGEIFVKACTINDKRLVLPTPTILQESNWEELIAFHPLSEGIHKGESEVISYLRRLLIHRLTGVSSMLLDNLLRIASNNNLHESFSPLQSKLLEALPEVDDKAIKVFNKLLSNHHTELINIYLKRNGTLDDEKYRRLASVNFPIWEEFNGDGTKVGKVEMGSLKIKKQIKALFEFVFEDLDDPGYWSCGSNSNIAPYFDSLTRAFAKIAHRLNAVVWNYRKYIDNYETLRTNLDWLEDLDRIDEWKNAIPALVGNKGASSKSSREEEVASSVMKDSPVQQKIRNREEETREERTSKPTATRSALRNEPERPREENGPLKWTEVHRQGSSARRSSEPDRDRYRPRERGGYGGDHGRNYRPQRDYDSGRGYGTRDRYDGRGSYNSYQDDGYRSPQYGGRGSRRR